MGSVLCLGKAIAVAAALLCGWKNGLKIRDLSRRFGQQGPHPPAWQVQPPTASRRAGAAPARPKIGLLGAAAPPGPTRSA